jgi:hypothetical protein
VDAEGLSTPSLVKDGIEPLAAMADFFVNLHGFIEF